MIVHHTFHLHKVILTKLLAMNSNLAQIGNTCIIHITLLYNGNLSSVV